MVYRYLRMSLKKEKGEGKIMKHLFAIITNACHCKAKPHACHCEGQSPKVISEKVPQSLLWQIMIVVCVSSFAIAILFFYPSLASAQIKEIIAEGTYNMGDGETPSVAESRALLQAKRTALEQAGTYVESYSKVKNFQLTEDEIKVITSGLISLRVNSPQLAA